MAINFISRITPWHSNGSIKATGTNPFETQYRPQYQKDKFERSASVTNPFIQTKPTPVIKNPLGENRPFSPMELLNLYTNPKTVKALTNINPNIQTVLETHKVPVCINPNNINNIKYSHIINTAEYARGIAQEMNLSESEIRNIELGAVFHDYGKILIPQEILDKTEKLTDKDKRIIDTHAQLGYELLKSAGFNEEVLTLVKNHHKPLKTNKDNIGTQILTVADIYSALTEERAYKKAYSQSEAFAIIDTSVQKGNLSAEVVQALKQSLKKHNN